MTKTFCLIFFLFGIVSITVASDGNSQDNRRTNLQNSERMTESSYERENISEKNIEKHKLEQRIQNARPIREIDGNNTPSNEIDKIDHQLTRLEKMLEEGRYRDNDQKEAIESRIQSLEAQKEALESVNSDE
ncbi:MAG: hypothetical protein EA412_07970 [Chitinophagaceae bacterium]|nr:MAG: hypothetical protein EA412_07970 [Chitinophagaceae bacterium]